MKLHVGCGAVYLEGYVNVDIWQFGSFLASENPDWMGMNLVPESDYYKNFKPLRTDRPPRPIVCDVFAGFGSLYESVVVPRGTLAHEILARQVWEHLSLSEAKVALLDCMATLMRGGILRLDVPDNHESMEKYRETGDTFYVRHVVGPAHKGSWGHHVMSYTREELKELVTTYGFDFVKEETNIHDYPAFCLRFARR